MPPSQRSGHAPPRNVPAGRARSAHPAPGSAAATALEPNGPGNCGQTTGTRVPTLPRDGQRPILDTGPPGTAGHVELRPTWSTAPSRTPDPHRCELQLFSPETFIRNRQNSCRVAKPDPTKIGMISRCPFVGASRGSWGRPMVFLVPERAGRLFSEQRQVGHHYDPLSGGCR